jgi:hypothetical protein
MATEIHFEPTLFVFLGTSAGQVGWRLKSLLHRAYGDVPILRFLWIDADSTLDPKAAEWFTSQERVTLTGFNGDAVLANLNNYPTIAAWWPRKSRLKAGFIQRGAKQIRLVGRLSLFRMYNERAVDQAFIDKLQAATEAIQHIDNIRATEGMSTPTMNYTVDSSFARVVIVFSTCGGTGSSMAFDVAYLCRKQLEDCDATIIGIAVLPPVIDKALKKGAQTQREKIRANTYAWFKENDYLLQNPHWYVTYPEGAPVSIYAPPFNLTFVVDIGNQAGERLNSDDDIYTLISQAIFLDTGSSIGGAMRGFNANVSVISEEFQRRPRAYSSLAAAALIYPKEKILNYCAARFAQQMINQGFLTPPDKDKVVKSTAALLGHLRMRDNQLLLDLLANRQIPNTNAPAIRKATTVEKIRGLLASQEARDSEARTHQVDKIAKVAARLLAEDQRDLPTEIVTIAIKKGGLFAQAVLDLLTAEPDDGLTAAEETHSLKGFRLRLAQQGVSEQDLSHAESAYRSARERLRAMEGDPKLAALSLIAKGRWKRLLDGARNDCLHWMAEVNQLTLQLAAQREAANYYDQMIQLAEELKSNLAKLVQNMKRAAEDLGQVAKNTLKPTVEEEYLYELSLEAVDADYIRDYYTRQTTFLDPAIAYQTFSESLPTSDMSQMINWHKGKIANAIQKHAQGYFEENLENTSLLHALAEYHGNQAEKVIKDHFDRLVRHCIPFWRYRRDSGISGLEGISIIGVEDEHSELIPAEYRENDQYELKSTGFKHEIYAARIRHGLPAFLLQGMDDFKTYYDKKRKGTDPLHVIPEAIFADEVIPEEKREARRLFVVASCFGYIVKIGNWYYFDPNKQYEKEKIHPGRGNQLAQGRQKAEEAFIQRDEFVQQAEQLIEQDITRMGNDAAIELLNKCIKKLKADLAKMAIDSEIRSQLEKEIRALKSKQRQLGYIGAGLDEE